MQNILSKYREFQKHLLTLKDYIMLNRDKEEAKYREYRDIIYGAIINRAYTLWETYAKDVFYEYFCLKKEEYYRNNTLIERYRLNELPGYLFETAVFNQSDESISFSLNKEMLSFTSKNMDMKELCKLFKRIDIDLNSKLDNDLELKSAVDIFEVSFENGLREDNKTTQALKRITQERNLVSHYAYIDTFENLDTLLEWINFYILLGNTLCKTICLEYVRTVDSNKMLIGECKGALDRNNVILIDIGKEVRLDDKSLLYVYRNDTLIDILSPISFKVEDKVVAFVESNNKAGIGVKSIFDCETRIKKEYKYYILEDVAD